MARPAGHEALVLTGDLSFDAGGVSTDHLTGAFVKSISEEGVATLQLSDGSERELVFHATGELTPAQVQAIVGQMFTNNEETGITATYDAENRKITLTVTEAGGGDENVQSDWDETDTESDAFIENKPTIPEEASAANVAARSGEGFVSARRLPAAPDLSGYATTTALQQEAQSRANADTALRGSIPTKASNADVDGESNDSGYTTVAKVFRAIARKVKSASATVRGIVLLARNTDVDATETDTSRVLTVASGKRLIARVAAVFTPSKANLYAAVKEIIVHSGSPGATADDTDNEIDIAGGGSSTEGGDITARVERINFGNVASGGANVELTPSAGGISVINGEGNPEILSGISGNDFTVAAGVYLVNIHGDFDTNSNVTVGFDIRRASDDAELDQSNTVFVRGTRNIHTSRILLILAADTSVNFFAVRSGSISMAALHAEFVRLSSGGAVHSAHNRYIGWAAQQTPTSLEIGAGTAFASDELTIPNPDPDGTIDDDDTPGWLWFAVPDDAGAPSAAYFDGNTHDILGGFEQLASGTFAGHIVYVTSAEQDPAILGTGSRTLTLEYD